MQLSENELFQLFIQRYTKMENSKSNTGRSYQPVKEVLDEFVSKFNDNNSTRSV